MTDNYSYSMEKVFESLYFTWELEMQIMIETLVQTVQHNCNIADARHGGDYTMCTYLMKMREFYRWEQQLEFRDRLPKEELGNWLSERENSWLDLEEEDFQPLTVCGETLDPFADEMVNELLRPHGLVYSAGLEGCARAQFYLAELESEERQSDGLTLRVSGRELARGLSAPAAMTREHSIYLRREALRRQLWERFEIWRWSSAKNALAEAYAGYDMHGDVEAALSQMADRELETVRQHEMGEYLAGEIVGDLWNRMLIKVTHTPAELMARAVRDHFADCAMTLPFLLNNRRGDSIHLFIGSLSGMRKQIFPALQEAYTEWLGNGGNDAFLRLAERGKDHWRNVALQLCDAYQQSQGSDCAARIVHIVEQEYL